MAKYPFSEIEPKWQKYWDANQTFRAVEDPAFAKAKRRYVLDMFPYPSGAGLHVGHPLGYIATDIYCRYLRMNGFNVLHPMGFDAFGLPAENYAIQTGTHPAVTTFANIERFKKQIGILGLSYDWAREVSTCTADYYKWTQWIFIQLFKRGLAYESNAPINWCPSCQTGLANEEVKDGECDRCGSKVTRKRIRQWVLKITAYADRLLADLDKVDWPEPVKAMQRNWIGRSEGASVHFAVDGLSEKLEVYTTRPDTLFGATYMVVAPEHPLVSKLTTPAQQAAMSAYVEAAARKSDLERTDLAKDKSGCFTGSYGINPVNGRKLPIWISDYVLISYGTGAIMAVPAHDERDWAFARKFGLPIIQVVAPEGSPAARIGTCGDPDEAFCEEGIAINSGDWNGLTTAAFKAAITKWLEDQGHGQGTVNYKLRDWLFSRQRYWGEPMPLVHCPKCGIVPLHDDQLPLTLPETTSYAPSGNGESPLANIEPWVNTTCPDCGSPARRETNTMPQWAGSCWYYLRFIDPRNDRAFADRAKVDYWMPVDLYVGGTEHAVLHLLYARFWHKVLFDIGAVNTDEPFQRLVNQGMMLGEDNQKMSKSRGNVVNPDDIIGEYGADALRLYEMFMGPLEVSKPWTTAGIVGSSRFLERLWAMSEKPLDDAPPSGELLRLLHRTIRKVTEDSANLAFNTAISALMVLSAEANKAERLSRPLWEALLKMVGPYAPHLAEELWQKLGQTASIAYAAWPGFDPLLCESDELTIVVQFNGKLRADFQVPKDTGREEQERLARLHPKVQEYLVGKEIVKVVVVPGKLVNFVVR
ncbi:MAG: leucine--tRNA ligase [Spirochaetes bacterium GWD1_61_31]|nr:MAG: leucine--tRNA ligase [Spirochaetes bacterium GWB1_60_80]OHD35412.1 MAG: leucine--tRNA ligase [Spirochaetes bacterium GWD1_61_31]OHD44920.1 MAG: leucine--tRNA ligase [Spirochaetes bacterium GWE1_60_18]OHD60031.1 MAG: leucine--tRNA ligase [Spirochaetes bacterium GWF1_60_12]HAP43715.1 leucine--tRNA ligase [Spirochaetaceae bacterium]